MSDQMVHEETSALLVIHCQWLSASQECWQATATQGNGVAGSNQSCYTQLYADLEPSNQTFQRPWKTAGV